MAIKYKSIEYYMALPWTYLVETHADYYTARVAEMPGHVISDGATPQEAIDSVREALKGVIHLYMDQEEEIPVPVDIKDFKGNISYRTEPEKHYKLAKEAQRRGTSINKLIDSAVEKTYQS